MQKIGNLSLRECIFSSLDLGISGTKRTKSALETARSKFGISTRMSSNPNSNPKSNNNEIDTPEEANVFLLKCKVAIIKSLIFGGYSVFTELLGIGGMSVAIPSIGAVVCANPLGVVIGSSIVFFAAFFTKLRIEMGIEDIPVVKKK